MKHEEMNEGIRIAIERMETHPEEFFDPKQNGKWSWLYAETTREVLTEEEKVAVHSALKKVRRLEITHKAIHAVLPEAKEGAKEEALYGFAQPAVKTSGQPVKYPTTIAGRAK